MIKYSLTEPKPSIKWFKDEEEIIVVTDEFYQILEIEDTISLIIKSVKPSCKGLYYVQLSNAAGKKNSNKAQLIVNCMVFLLFVIILTKNLNK